MTGIVNEVAGEHEEKAFYGDSVAEEGGVGAFLNVLEVGAEGFEAVKEVGGAFVGLGFAFHPFDLGVLKKGSGLEFVI